MLNFDDFTTRGSKNIEISLIISLSSKFVAFKSVLKIKKSSYKIIEA